MNINVTLTDTEIANLLCGAFEGGSNYWYGANRVPYKWDSKPGSELELSLPVEVWDFEDSKKKYKLDREAIDRGISLLSLPQYRRFLADIIDENDDATTSDVFLQLCLFGEIVYG